MDKIKKKQRATKQVRIYPSVHDQLRQIAFKKRISIAAVISELVERV